MTSETVSLKEFFLALLAELEKRIEVSRVGMEKRLDGMNEFRDALRDQNNNSPTRTEMDAKLDALEKELKALNTFKDNMDGKASQNSVLFFGLIAILSLVISIVKLFI